MQDAATPKLAAFAQDRQNRMNHLGEMTASQVTYSMESTLETVNEAEALAVRFAEESGFDESDVMQISLSVREAAINAVMHGNERDPSKKVGLGFERTASEMIITIRDEGSGLDVASLPDPLAPENLMKTSGRGIFLIRTMMDEVQFRILNPGSEIKMKKRVPGPAANSEETAQ